MSGKSCGWSSGALAVMEPGARGRWLAEKERSWVRSIAAEDPRISSICPVVWKEKMRSVIMAREQAELWKTRDNGGKAAWLFIGVLSSVYWVSDVITDDELAVLIMRACSSRNLFVKHHKMKTFMKVFIGHFNIWMSSADLYISLKLYFN